MKSVWLKKCKINQIMLFFAGGIKYVEYLMGYLKDSKRGEGAYRHQAHCVSWRGYGWWERSKVWPNQVTGEVGLL